MCNLITHFQSLPRSHNAKVLLRPLNVVRTQRKKTWTSACATKQGFLVAAPKIGIHFEKKNDARLFGEIMYVYLCGGVNK